MLHSENKILILGGDERQESLLRKLLRNGFCAKHISRDGDFLSLKNHVSQADIIILPLPVTKDKKAIYSKNNALNFTLGDFLDYISPLSSIMGGMICGEFEEKLKEKNIAYYDFYTDEKFVSYNAHLTAQGAVRILLENTQKYIVSQKVLLTGFGRVSKALAFFLKGLSLDVYVAARNEAQRKEAQNFGLKTLDISDIEKTVYMFDYIFNTVESNIFSSHAVGAIKESALYIELASPPYGANKTDFENRNIKYISAPQVPGRFYPEQSAGAILKSISDLL